MLQDGFLPYDLAIEISGMIIVMARRRSYNTKGDNQVLHSQPLEPDNIKVSIIESLHINAYLLYLTDVMTTVGAAVGSFIAWPIEFVSLHAQICYQN